jgi:hypothetical protein
METSKLENDVDSFVLQVKLGLISDTYIFINIEK